MRKYHIINSIEERRADREELVLTERGNGNFILKQWEDGVWTDRIFLTKDDMRKIFDIIYREDK
jgi:hypothetical protein